MTIEVSASRFRVIIKTVEELDEKISEISRIGVVKDNDREILSDIMKDLICKIFNAISTPEEAINFASATAQDRNRRGDKILTEAIKFLTGKALKSIKPTENTEEPGAQREHEKTGG